MSRGGHTLSATLLAFLVAACTTAAPPLTPSPPITPSPQPTVPDNTPATPSPSGTATASPSPSPSPSPETRTVTSDDGRVTVEVPLSEPLADDVGVRAMTADEAPQELKDAGVAQACYELLPGEGVFSSPVTITSTWPAATDLGALRFFFHIIRAPDGTWAWLNDSTITYTAESTTVTGTTTHFSTLCRFTDRTDLTIDPEWPRTDLVEGSFTRTISLVSQDSRPNPIEIESVLFEPALGPIEVSDANILGPTSFDQQWTCLEQGVYAVSLTVNVINFAADNPFFTETLGIDEPLDATINVRHDGACVIELPSGVVDRICIAVVHEALGDFVSFLDFLLWFLGPPTDDFDYIEVVIEGANDGQPQRLTVDSDGRWSGQLGLRNAGGKTLVSVIAHRIDGSTLDITDDVAEAARFIGRDFTVRFPEEDKFGECD